MRILAIDTSGPVCGAAVLDGETVLSEAAAQNNNTHSVSLMPMTERCLESAGMSLADVDALAVTVGPGSFTGVRLGVATVKGLAHGSGKPCIPVNALEALAESCGRRDWDGLICPMQDARAGQIYGACFRRGERLTEDRAVRLEDYLEAVRALHQGPWLFTGDGMRVHRERIREILGENALLAEPGCCFLRPSAVALLAARKGIGAAVDYLHLKETYLRPPNAEKNKKLLDAMRRV